MDSLCLQHLKMGTVSSQLLLLLLWQTHNWSPICINLTFWQHNESSMTDVETLSVKLRQNFVEDIGERCHMYEDFIYKMNPLITL